MDTTQKIALISLLIYLGLGFVTFSVIFFRCKEIKLSFNIESIVDIICMMVMVTLSFPIFIYWEITENSHR